MPEPDDRDLLALWELGLNRHPIDRGLLLGAWARPDLPSERLAELPVGALNSALLRLREAWFGPRIEAVARCPECGTPVELDLSIPELLTVAVDGDERELLEVSGYRFRPPDSRDLAALAPAARGEGGALLLLERCCVSRPDAPAPEPADLLSEVEAALEIMDPVADIELNLACLECGRAWTDSLPVVDLLWDDLDSRIRLLFEQIHTLASTYGWTESEILSLSPNRRAIYVEMVGG